MAAPIHLDARLSHDPNFPPNLRANDTLLRFTWTCIDLSGIPCRDVAGTPLPVASMPHFQLQLPAGSYRLTLHLSKPGYDSAMASALVKVVSVPKLSVAIDPLPLSHHDPSRRLTLHGSSSSPGASYQWRSVSPSELGQSGGLSVDLQATGVSNTPTTQPSLVINPGVLTAGSRYVFELSVTDADMHTSGYSQLIINLLFTTYYLLLTTYYLLPNIYYLLLQATAN